MEGSAELKVTNQNLCERIKQLEETLEQSGIYGKQLLAERSDMARQLQVLQEKYKTEISAFKAKLEDKEQGIHTFKSRAESAGAEAISASEEVETMKEKLRRLSGEKEAERKNTLKLLQKIDRLEEELESAAAAATIVGDQARKREDKRLAEEQEAHSRNSEAHNETNNNETQLRLELEEAAEEKIKLQDALDEKEKLIFDYEVTIGKLRDDTMKLKLELSDKECQSTSYFNALENARQEILEQQVEMQQMQIVETDPRKRGNSLFSEVDDRRKKLEDGFKTLRTKYSALCQTNEINEGRIRKLQMQLAMQPASTSQQVNASHIFQLEQSLELANSEIKKLLATATTTRSSCSPTTSTVNDEFLSINATVKFKESSDDGKQIDGLWLKILAERDLSRETRKKLYACEKREEKLVGENRRLKMKLYERDNVVEVDKGDIDSPKTNEPNKVSNPSSKTLQEMNLVPDNRKETIGRTSSKLAKKESAKKKHEIVVTKVEMKEECKQQ